MKQLQVNAQYMSRDELVAELAKASWFYHNLAAQVSSVDIVIGETQPVYDHRLTMLDKARYYGLTMHNVATNDAYYRSFVECGKRIAARDQRVRREYRPAAQVATVTAPTTSQTQQLALL